MKNKWMKKTLVFILAAGFLAAVNQGFTQTCYSPIVIGEITQAETESLVFMREEEKMARDVYVAMFEIWQTPVFANIANSEQNHMDAIKFLLDAYELEDPAQNIGVFTNPELQTLYNQLVERGIVSELEALKVGALIEELDIQDLKDALTETAFTNIQQVYQQLMAGSENHLRAFVRNIEFQESPYTAQYLSQEEVDLILSSTNTNQGGRGRGGFGQNGGQGRGRQGNWSNRTQNQNFVDANGDGLCDLTGMPIQSCQMIGQGRGRQGNRANRIQNQNFVDANGDGICDLTGMAVQSGQANKRGRGNQGTRRGRRGN